MSLLNEFKAFVMRGNVVDMAIGVIVGVAFGKVVSSLVADIMMPPLGMILGKIDFTQLAWVLKPASGNTPAVTLKYGQFINTIIDFLIIAAAIFIVIKALNRFQKKPATKTQNCPECLMEIPKAAKRCGHCGEPLHT